METAIFENLKKALESLTIEDDEYTLVRHILKPGKKTRLHYHPKATEWLIIDNGIFDVQVEGIDGFSELRRCQIIYQTKIFLFPKRRKHAIKAITEIEYFVLRDKKDKTVYVKGGQNEQKGSYCR